MAEEVQIAFTADMSDITAQIEKLPGVSKEEADKMAKNIKKGLKDTEKAAKKAASSNVKAMKKVEQQNNRVTKSYRKMKRGASEMGRGLGEVASIVGDGDSKFAAYVDTLAMASISFSALIPLAGAAMQKIKSLGASMALSAGPIGLLGVGLGVVTYKLATMEGPFQKMADDMRAKKQAAEKLNAKLKLMADGYENLSVSMQKAADNAKSLLSQLDNRSWVDSTRPITAQTKTLRHDLDLLKGRITELTAARLKIADATIAAKESEKERIKKAYKADEAQVEASLKAVREKLTEQRNYALKYYNEYYQAQSAAHKANLDIIYNTEDARIKAAATGFIGLKKLSSTFMRDMQKNEYFEKKLEDRLDPTSSKYVRGEEKEEIKQTLAALDEKRKVEEEILILEEKKKNREKAKEQAKKNTADLEKQIAQSQKNTNSLSQKNLQTSISLTEDKEKLIELTREKAKLDIAEREAAIAAFDAQKKKAVSIAKSDEQKILAQELSLALDQEKIELEKEIANIKVETAKKIQGIEEKNKKVVEEVFDVESLRLKELYALEAELRDASTAAEKEKHKLVLDQIKERETAQRQAMGQILSNVEGFFSARLQMLQNMGDAEKDAVLKTFYMQQAASMANVVMQTAENIIAAQSLLPPTGPILAASYIALGGAQMAAIASQKPPTARHMGGMANDEMNYRLLTGEAVLSRQAVRNVGGEQGLKRMERGQGSGGDVIILQPFKHFDRYLNQRNRRKARRASNGSY